MLPVNDTLSFDPFYKECHSEDNNDDQKLINHDISGIDSEWDVTEVSEADALAFAQAIWADAEIDSDGILTNEEPDDPAAE